MLCKYVINKAFDQTYLYFDVTVQSVCTFYKTIFEHNFLYGYSTSSQQILINQSDIKCTGSTLKRSKTQQNALNRELIAQFSL